VVPFFGHKITVSTAPGGKDGGGGPETRTVSVYGSGESNYLYQLRRFAGDVAALRGLGGGGRRARPSTGQRAARRGWGLARRHAPACAPRRNLPALAPAP
jgi:hypothetical protein